ncbi:response regulator [Flavobacterium sp. LBUM151]
MIKVCLADNHPVTHFGVKSYFKDHDQISIVANVGNFSMVRDILQTKEIDILILDLELEGLSSIFEVKSILKNFPKTKIVIFSDLAEQMYAPNAIKAGVSGYVHKTEKLETLGLSIIKVHEGKIIINETVRKNMALIAKQSAILSESKTLSEEDFWSCVADCIAQYQEDQPHLKEQFKKYDLFATEFDSCCLNRLQLRNNKQMLDLADPIDSLQFVGKLKNPVAMFVPVV